MDLAPRAPARAVAWTMQLICTLCCMSPQMSEGHRAMGPGHGEGKGRKNRKGKGGRGAGPGVLCYHQSGCHNSSTVASWAGWAMGFHRAVNHLSGSHAFPPVLKRLGFLSHRSDGKLGEGGGGQVLEIFSGGIPNRIPLKSDPGWEVDAVQLTSGPRCASARTNSCIEDSWAISSGHPHWECFLLPCRERGREAPCTQCAAPRCSQPSVCAVAFALGIQVRHGRMQKP